MHGGGALSALVILAIMAAAFSCGHSDRTLVNSQLNVSPNPKAVALTGPSAGGGGNNNLLGGGGGFLENPPTKLWTEPNFGRTVTIASDCVIIELDGPWTQPSPEELPVDIAPLDEAFENNIIVQSLIASGYELEQTWGEVNGGLFKLPPGMTVTQALSGLPSLYPGIWKVYPDALNEASIIPNDPYFNNQWNFINTRNFDVDAPQAWDLETGDENSIVAVIDSGVVRACFPNRITAWGAQVGRRMLTPPWSMGGGEPIVGIDDDWKHGTMVASTIAAPTNDNLDLAGSMWNGKIFPVRIESWYSSALLNAYRVVAATKGIIWDSRYGNPLHSPQVYSGIKATNVSGGGYSPCFCSMRFIYRYLGAYTVFVCSAGNEKTWIPCFPAGNRCYTGYMPDLTLGVGAFDVQGYLMDDPSNPNVGSNYGLYNCDVAAPGVNIPVFEPILLNSYIVSYRWSGTSLSSPQVAAMAALCASYHPNESSMMILNRAHYGSLKMSPSLHSRFTLEHNEPMPIQCSFYNCLVCW